MSAAEVNADALLSALTAVLHPSLEQRKPAEEFLLQSEAQKGFIVAMLNIASTDQRELSVALLALTMVKNAVHRRWRKTGQQSTTAEGIVSEEEKLLCRQILISMASTVEDKRIGEYLALIVARVARIDFPQAWPALFEELLGALRGVASMKQRLTVANVMHKVVKELSSRTLAMHRMVFRKATEMILPPILEIWAHSHDQIGQSIQNHTDEVVLRLFFVLTKTVGLLLAYGVTSIAPDANPTSTSILTNVNSWIDTWKAVLTEEKGKAASEQTVRTLQTSMYILSSLFKLVYTVQDRHSTSFSFAVSGFSKSALSVADALLSLRRHWWSAPNGEHFAALDKTLVRVFLFLKSVTSCMAYQPSAMKSAAPSVMAALEDFQQVWSDHTTLHSLLESIIRSCLVFRPADLEEIEMEPEAFTISEEVDDWMHELRPCAERVILALLEQRTPIVAPLLLQIVQAQSGSDIWVREAVYGICGAGAHYLFDYLKFRPWFEGDLNAIIQGEYSDGSLERQILKRRAILTVGGFVEHVTGDSSFVQLVYETVVAGAGYALAHKSVLTASATVSCLRSLLTDLSFQRSAFAPLVARTLEFVSSAIDIFDEGDGKLQCMSLLEDLMYAFDGDCSPDLQGIVKLIASVWQREVADFPLLRAPAIRTLTKFVEAFGIRQIPLDSFVWPIIREATDIKNPDHLYLMDDALGLWEAVVDALDTVSPAAMALVPQLLSILDHDFEHISNIVKILRTYVLLGGKPIMQEYGNVLSGIIAKSLFNVKDRGVVLLCELLDVMMVVDPSACNTCLVPVMDQIVAHILSHREQLSSMVASHVLCVLGRYCLQDAPAFAHRVHSYPVDGALQVLANALIEMVDHVGKLELRKLMSLALCTILANSSEWQMQNPDVILTTCLGLIDADMDEYLHSEMMALNGEPDEDGNYSDAYGSILNAKSLEVMRSDPVRCTTVSKNLAEALRYLQTRIGAEHFAAFVASLDSVFVPQLQDLMQAP